MAFIGLNGSGKSNVLEALSFIFREIYQNKQEDILKKVCKNIPFEFEIFFKTLNSKDSTYRFIGEKGNFTFSNSSFDDEPYEIDERAFVDAMPKKVVTIYSGEEKRLWSEFYKPVFDNFIKNINSSKVIPKQDMVFISRKHWGISLLSLLLSDLEDNQNFIKEVLKIEKIDKIKIQFNKKRYKSWETSQTKEFIKLIDLKEEYLLEELRRILEVYPSNEVFKYFYNALLSEMITDIQIFFNDDNLTIGDLSEGEKKLLLLKAAFEFVAQEDSLFMLDEPDSHIHLDNKKHIIDILKQYKDNRQFIVTTHSPTLTQCIKNIDNDDKSRVYVLDSGKNIPSKETKEIEYLVGDFWNAQEQTVFLSSHKDMVLLVEGKHDKAHILNAWKHYKDDYPTLDFDVFNMDGEANITQLLTGLRTSEYQNHKKYIGIFDNDDAGIDACNQTQVKYSKDKKCKKTKDKFFAITYSKPEKYEKRHWTVENLLPLNKYGDSYKEVIRTHNFTAKKIDDTSRDIQKKSKSNLG